MNKVKKISTGRIMRAIREDNYSGFCKECGHEQGGCEPDARNYVCENCGKPAVFGAEELLMEIVY